METIKNHVSNINVSKYQLQHPNERCPQPKRERKGFIKNINKIVSMTQLIYKKSNKINLYK